MNRNDNGNETEWKIFEADCRSLKNTSVSRCCLKQSRAQVQCDDPGHNGMPNSHIYVNGKRYCDSRSITNSQTFVAGPKWIQLEGKIFFPYDNPLGLFITL